MLNTAQIKEIEKIENEELEAALRLIFRNQFTNAPKAKEEKSLDQSEDKKTFNLGYSFMGLVKIDPKTKKKTVVENVPVRTYKTFMYYAGFSDMLFFTPNTFGRAWKRVEENVDYLNALVVDIDDCDCFVALWERFNESGIPFLPTMINKTDKGYHVYFVLKQPLKAKKGNRTRYKKVLKGLIHKLGGDKAAASTVNYYRIPRKVEYLNENNLVDFEKAEAYIIKEFTADNGKFIVPGYSSGKVMESDAVLHLLENGVETHRNWTAWAIAKCCAYDGLSESDALEVLEGFNRALESNNKGKLRPSELKAKVKSAYSKNDGRIPVDFIYEMTGMRIVLAKKWVKHAKSREERKLVHGHERLEDLITYLKDNNNIFEGSQKALAESLNAPERSIKMLLKELREGKYEEMNKKLIIRTIGAGRSAKTILILKEETKEKVSKDTAVVTDLLEYRNNKGKSQLPMDIATCANEKETVQVANNKGKGAGGRNPIGDVVTLPSESSRTPVEAVDPRGKPKGFST